MILKKSFTLKGINPKLYPIVQGGMGAGISLAPLAQAVGENSGLGTISSVGLDQITPQRLNISQQVFDQQAKSKGIDAQALAVIKEIEETRCGRDSSNFPVAINIMHRLYRTYHSSLVGATLGKANAIVVGAGIPRTLPKDLLEIKKEYFNDLTDVVKRGEHHYNLIPIVSNAKMFELICRCWQKYDYIPDAVILEGPKAGGHLGFFYKYMPASQEEFLKQNDLFDVLLEPALDIAKKYGGNRPIPIIVAGGIYDNSDIEKALSIDGVVAVQMGSRFAATDESTASEKFKQAYLDTTKEDIIILPEEGGSPAGLPFRITKRSQVHENVCMCTALLAAYGIRKDYAANKCPEGYMLDKAGNCNAFYKASNKAIYTCGYETDRIKEILPVSDLIKELIGYE